MIDLHTHTTASDGRLSPAELAARARAAGVTVLAVTDHDTVAGCAEAAEACRTGGPEFVAGIEVTAVAAGADVHVLGYFIDTESPALQTFLIAQRQERIDRLRQMIDRLAALGVPLDADEILRPGLEDAGKAPGRPWIARALVSAGRVSSTAEAFDRWLARGRPAFVPRDGVSPERVFGHIHEAGGLASLAHPTLVGHDEWIPRFAEAGLDAIEAYHSDHDGYAVRRYVEMARTLGLAVSGGSDYHGEATHGPPGPGCVSLPREEYEGLKRRRSG